MNKKKPQAVFDDIESEPSVDAQTKKVLSELHALRDGFKAAAAKAPKSFPLWRRAIDKPQWTKTMCENTGKLIDIAARAFQRGDKKMCKDLMFFAKRDFDEQARRHAKASGYLFVGKKNKELAKDFAGYSSQAMKILDLLL